MLETSVDAPTTLSDKLINTHNLTQEITPNASSTIISSTARQHSKRRSSATPLYVTKIPPTKKPNTGFEPKLLSENMISRAEKQESRHRARTTATLPRRRSLSPQTGPTPSHLARLALKADQQPEEKFSKVINPMEELLQRMVAVENRASTSEQRLFSAEEELKTFANILEENQQLHEANKQLKFELEKAHAEISALKIGPQNPVEITINDSDMLEVEAITTTKDSIHALSEAAWSKRRAEIEKNRNLVAADKEKQLQKQLHQLNSQQPRHKQPKNHQQEQMQRQQQKHRQHQTVSSPTSYATVTSKHLPLKKRNVRPPTEKMINWAHRLLQPATDNTAYTIVYIPSPRRTLYSEIRRALSLVGIAQEQVIDIQFPARGTVGLLIHTSYEKELRELLAQAKLHTKDEFNPISATIIGDPTLLAKLTEDERATAARKIYQERMFNLCMRLPKKHLQVAILRHFTTLPSDNNHHLDVSYWTKFQEAHPKPTRNHSYPSYLETDSPPPTHNNHDSNDDKEAMQEDQ
ncbi:hypothetical protein BDC45DRAFT_566507 [Circinella umbellata]|nr:hypothetical protein BDC45DRAFT_566507 [Circinella umbellata]